MNKKLHEFQLEDYVICSFSPNKALWYEKIQDIPVSPEVPSEVIERTIAFLGEDNQREHVLYPNNYLRTKIGLGWAVKFYWDEGKWGYCGFSMENDKKRGVGGHVCYLQL